MRTRTLLVTALVGVIAAGSAAPSFASKPKPISGSFTAQATPDPTSDTPGAAGGKGKCDPKTASARVTHAFTMPAAGTLHVSVNNKLDWSSDIRTADGEIQTDSDGSNPTDPEAMDLTVKKKTAVTIGVCNDEGEPSITVTYTFTFK